ncbi:MAG: sigma-54-dependent Fis family transcriptional regulator [Deltaproteobacteria bacterium]|nr:MAG: sigma-54-dependent Fis family transcriptional regulator [Deltaproteobacteria bacterium]
MSRRILVVDDDASMRSLLVDDLKDAAWDVRAASSSEEAIGEVDAHVFDAVVTDLNMPGMNGIELCRRIGELEPGLPVIVVTGFGSLETAIAAIRAGAYDFITKPFEVEALVMVLERAVRLRTLEREVHDLRVKVSAPQRFNRLSGESAVMVRLRQEIAQVAGSTATVLIRGESGVGKELVARCIHENSPFSEGPLVTINAASTPAQLIESELFGHVKGAFTGAVAKREGLFMRAQGGTLFLDEIGEMPLELQPKLLRALEDHKIRPVGSDHEVTFQGRVIAATNRDLESAIADGQFREDLFYRLNVLDLDIPPLCSRGRDVLLIAQEFLERFAEDMGKDVRGLSPAAAERLMAYPWPGNVRELRNSMERAVALADHTEVVPADLPARIRDYQRSHVLIVGESPDELVSLETVERRYILRVLELVDNNKTEAARVLGVGRKTLYRKLEQYRAED